MSYLLVINLINNAKSSISNAVGNQVQSADTLLMHTAVVVMVYEKHAIEMTQRNDSSS